MSEIMKTMVERERKKKNKNKQTNKDRKEERSGTSYSENMRAK